MIGILILTSLAFVLGLILVLLDYKLRGTAKIEEEIEKLLPGYNCGACGYGSCSGMSIAMMSDINNYHKCRPLKGESLKEIEAYIRKNNL